MRKTNTAKTALALAGALTIAISGGAAADGVTDQIDSARAAYEAGRLKEAVDTLNFAVAEIQTRITDQPLLLLPEPLEGWQADEAQSESAGIAAMITGTNLSRRYYRDDGAEIEIGLMADSPMLPMLTMFLSTPFMMQADPNTKPFTMKGLRGMIKREDGNLEVTLIQGGNTLIQLTGSGGVDEPTIRQYIDALDLEGIRSAFGPQ